MDNWLRVLVDFTIIGLLIVAVRYFRNPKGARASNLTAALVLFCALLLVVSRNRIFDPGIVIISLFIGLAIGGVVAARVNMIQIPSIFFESGIEKGSVSLKFYYTGSLMDEAVDSLQNGELISTMGDTAGSVVGMVLYNEGFVLLTSSVSINTTSYDDYLGTGNAATNVNPNWTYFGSYLPTSSAEGFPTASISALTFKGTHKIPTMTMFATIQPGEANNSLNPTWISSSNGDWRNRTVTGSTGYVEPRQLVIKNTIQSQYCDFEEGFSKQTFITEVGIYDDDKNLIGIAKLANPVMKQELDEYTFKLKLDL